MRTPTLYYTLDPTVLWFINTIQYCRCLALGCFMSNSFFIKQTAYIYSNNYIYDKWHEIDWKVLVFQRHDIII